MALNVGSRLGHYSVTALIGEGGMGQVYQATDTKLNRQVAAEDPARSFRQRPYVDDQTEIPCLTAGRPVRRSGGWVEGRCYRGHSSS